VKRPSQGFLPVVDQANWLEALLSEALLDEAVAPAALELRYEPAGHDEPEVDRLHADGAYLRAVWTLYAPATLCRDAAVQRPVPGGHTLLMTAPTPRRRRAGAVGIS
jgi:hypothetical protein